MKIAVLAPIAWRTPPRKYGPWELVASNITEELVKRGFDVTLFATGDSITGGKLSYTCSRGYEEDKNCDPKVAECLHISYLMERAGEFDIIHNHFDFLLTYSRLIKTSMVTTIHGFHHPKLFLCTNDTTTSITTCPSVTPIAVSTSAILPMCITDQSPRFYVPSGCRRLSVVFRPYSSGQGYARGN